MANNASFKPSVQFLEAGEKAQELIKPTNPYNDYVDANGKEWRTFYVTNFEDNGSDDRPLKGSLREAIKEGHRWIPYGFNARIVFQTDKASETIKLKSPLQITFGDWSINEGEAFKHVTLSGNTPHQKIHDSLKVSYNQSWDERRWGSTVFRGKELRPNVAITVPSGSNSIESRSSILKEYSSYAIHKSIKEGEKNSPLSVITVTTDSNIIESHSKILKDDSSKAMNLKTVLDPNKGYVIYQSIENGEKNIVTPSCTNDEQLLGAIRQHASYTYRTKSEQEIKDSRTSFFGSEVSKSMGKFVASQGASVAMGSEAAEALKAKATAKVTTMAATMAGKATLGVTGVFGAAAAIGIGALFHDSQETARIEEELAVKRAIDAEHDAFKAALPKRLEFNPINTLQARRVNIYQDFDFTHRDSAYFLPAGMDTDISYASQTDGRDVVRFSYIPKSLKDSSTVTNSAKEYARWVLSEELTKAMRNEAGKDPSGYISTLKKVNDKGEIFLTNTGRWQVQLSNLGNYYSGPADDRIRIRRQSSFGVSTMTQTYSGDDIVIGDKGENTILLGNGNDTATPGSGKDHVDGGAGIDSVSYLDLNQPIHLTAGHSTRHIESFLQVSNQQAISEHKSINSRLFNVESIDAKGGSTLDLSSAKPASRSFDNSKAADANYRIRTGSGSTVIGSIQDDGIIIDCGRQSLYNSKINRLNETSFIDGGAGEDSLLIKNLADHQQAGRQFKIDMLTGTITSTDATNQQNQSTQRIWFNSQGVEEIGLQGASISEDGLIQFDKEVDEITSFRPLQPETEFQPGLITNINPVLENTTSKVEVLA